MSEQKDTWTGRRVRLTFPEAAAAVSRGLTIRRPHWHDGHRPECLVDGWLIWGGGGSFIDLDRLSTLAANTRIAEREQGMPGGVPLTEYPGLDIPTGLLTDDDMFAEDWETHPPGLSWDGAKMVAEKFGYRLRRRYWAPQSEGEIYPQFVWFDPESQEIRIRAHTGDDPTVDAALRRLTLTRYDLSAHDWTIPYGGNFHGKEESNQKSKEDRKEDNA